MTVEELIEELMELDLDKRVFCIHSQYNGHDNALYEKEATVYISASGYVYIMPENEIWQEFVDEPF